MSKHNISGIYIYPVKSLGGISLQSSMVEERGLKYDRRWMLVNENNKFLTQRIHPQMALLYVEMENDRLIIKKKKQNKIMPLNIPLIPNLKKEVKVRVWKDNVHALVYDDNVNNWFSKAIGFNCKLVYMPDSTKRKVDEQYAVNKIVGFADGYPLMMTGEESLNDLNSKLKHPLPMNRFRPSIVFSGGDPFDEDNLKSFKIGDLQFRVVKPCSRCVITTVDPETGGKGKEPLKTLSTYREKDGKVYFGMNVVADSVGIINVGNPLKVNHTTND